MRKLSQGCAFKILKKIFSLESSVSPWKWCAGIWERETEFYKYRQAWNTIGSTISMQGFWSDWWTTRGCLAQVRYFYKANTGERWKANIEAAPTGKPINYQHNANTANLTEVTINASLSMQPPHQNTNEFLIRSKYIDSLKNVQKSDCQSNYDSKISGCVKYCWTENSWIIWDIFHLGSWRAHRK